LEGIIGFNLTLILVSDDVFEVLFVAVE